MGIEIYNEKVSVNMNSATLASIDLLVDNGYYSNRSDFINQAVRESLKERQSIIDRIVEKNESMATYENGNWKISAKASKSTRVGDHWFFGVSGITRRELEELRSAGEKLRLKGYGVLVIDQDCEEEMLFSVVEEIKVKGKVCCPDSVKKHYGLK